MTRGKEFHSHTNGDVNGRSTPYNNVSVSPLPFSSPLSPGPSFFDPFHCREGKEERGLLWSVGRFVFCPIITPSSPETAPPIPKPMPPAHQSTMVAIAIVLTPEVQRRRRRFGLILGDDRDLPASQSVIHTGHWGLFQSLKH